MPFGRGEAVLYDVEEVVKDAKLPLEKLRELFQRKQYYHERNSIIQHVVKRPEFSKYDKLEFLMEIMEGDSNLRTASYAGLNFRKLSGWNYKSLALGAFQEWWKKNKDDLKKQQK